MNRVNESAMKLRPLSFTRCAPSPLGCVGMGMGLGGGGRRRTILVALRRDATGRELLTWALVKAASFGDRVIALHVSTVTAAAGADGEEMPAAAAAEEKARAVDSLISVLGANRGFCERNEIDLELQLCEAPSVKKALVAEATSCGAAHLVVGVTKMPSGSSAATAVARYCANRVPPSCKVTAVTNGAVVFRRDPVHQPHHHQQLLLSPYSAVVETPRRLYRKILDARTTDKSQDDMAIGDGSARSVRRHMSAAMSALVSPRVKLAPAAGDKSQDDIAIGDGARSSARRHMSAAMSALVSPRVKLTPRAGHKSQDDLAIGDGARPARRHMSAAMNALVSPRVKPARVRPAPAWSCHGQQQESPKVPAGWPLLKKDNMPALPELSEVSVVEWAMQLPDRCSDQRSDERGEEKPVPEELVELRDKFSSKYTVFGYSELAKITNGFSPDRLVGRGGSGRVYMGRTEDGKELAVKVLKPSDDVVKDFVSEIEILSSVQHENAMSLVGFCVDGGKDRLMLVSDYVPRGNLQEVLHGHGHGSEKQGKGAVLGWPERYRVAAGLARALEYLHGDGEGHRPMIHRDIKSSNILVAGDFEPKLCDFGIAMWADDAAAQVTVDDIAGTFGYLAPEYFMHGKVSEKVDVYAFGVVLLELISGRKPVTAGGGGAKGKGSLVMWADSVIQGGNIMDLVDPNLPPTDGDRGVVERMALAAALCIRRAHQLRPSMSNVVKLLAGDDDAVSWAQWELGLPGGDDNDGRQGCGAGPVTSSPEKSDIQSYINLALRDVVDDDASSVGSGVSLEEYLKGRWSRSSSFEG